MSIYADLHIHTTNSDGTLTLEDLPAVANEYDISVVAVTDHDRIHPDISDPIIQVEDVIIIHGIELRVQIASQRIDLLGYGVTSTSTLRAEINRLQNNRVQRAKRIVEQIEEHLNITLDVEYHRGIGRPHIARAVINHPDTSLSYDEVFDELIGEGKPCYVARNIPSFSKGHSILTEACSVVGLAHPFRYDDPESALEVTTELDAVERYYPYDQPDSAIRNDLLETIMNQHDLLPIGGSDAHNEVIGKTGLNEAEYQDFAAALTNSMS